MDCHRNHAFSHSPNMFIFRPILFSHLEGLTKNLVCIKMAFECKVDKITNHLTPSPGFIDFMCFSSFVYFRAFI